LSHPRHRTIYWLASILALFASFSLLASGLLPFALLKTLGDRLSKDGNLESLTPERYHAWQPAALVFGAVLLACGLISLFRREATIHWIARAEDALIRTGRALKIDSIHLFQDLFTALPRGWEAALLAVITIIGGIFRWAVINRPIEYDEAYTFVEFARHPFRELIADYSVPNNHVFHTILVRLSYLLFGNAPWSVRLPVFVSGLLLILAVYLLAASLYTRTTAMVSAALVAFTPNLVIKSVTARGYILVALFFFLGLLAGLYAARHKNRAAWLLLSVFIALGMYTNPTSLFPVGVTALWLAGFGARDHQRLAPSGYRNALTWSAWLAGSFGLAVLLTVLFYAPIFLRNGILTVFNGARIVDPNSLAAFIAGLPDMVNSIFSEWGAGIDGLVGWGIALGVLFSLWAGWRKSAAGIWLQGAFVLFLAAALLVQRPNSVSRMWLWALPLALMWSVAGWEWIFKLIYRKVSLPKAIRALPGALAVLAFLFLAAQYTILNPPPEVFADPTEPEKITQYLRAQTTANDVIVVSDASNAQFWYYAIRYGIPDPVIRRVKSRPFQLAFFVVYPGYKVETLENDINDFGPDGVFLKMDTAKVCARIGTAVIYEIDANPDAIHKEFGSSGG
jgi:hypothetical protein